MHYSSPTIIIMKLLGSLFVSCKQPLEHYYCDGNFYSEIDSANEDLEVKINDNIDTFRFYNQLHFSI